MQSSGDLTAHIKRESAIERSARVMQLEGVFDVPAATKTSLEWNVRLPLGEKNWNIGLIVGPSGCGKSTVARELWPEALASGFAWDERRSILDSFPETMGIKEITLLLSSVGFSSPPSWMRPFQVLSNGEQFRTMVARAIAERAGELLVIDEFTSVVDRTVAQIGSAAIAKTVRRRGSQFIAVTCHYDVEAWLDPDWVYEPATDRFRWRSLQGRPAIALTIYRCHYSEWRRFAPHHYLSAELNRSAKCFLTCFDGWPVAFHAYLPFIGRLRGGSAAVRVHRMVCLPDFQGVGIAAAAGSHLAGMWGAMGRRVFITSGHPGVIAGLRRCANWRMTRAPSRTPLDRQSSLRGSRAHLRLTAGFEYCGELLDTRTAERQFNQLN